MFIILVAFIKKGKAKALIFPAGLSGTIVKVITGLSKNEVSFYFEDHLATIALTLDATIALANDYYPMVNIFTTNKRVYFISYEILV